eukprot:GHVS01074470.1.p1 GENE.GHVS01074470.1~~GHVS01074470.1.p1  ORF type:complete len:448 (+),score=16.40 GHVS01074470.1:130-1473(+)
MVMNGEPNGGTMEAFSAEETVKGARSLCSSTNKKVCYFYDEEIGNYHYGTGHPMRPHRIKMTNELVEIYGLHSYLELMMPVRPAVTDLTRFHTDDYVEFLKAVHPGNIVEYSDQLSRFNVGEDCPIFDGLWDFCLSYAGGSLGGAQKLMRENYDIAINWAGGLHHAKKSAASGFCYINDCVLASLEFLRYKHRVLYVDIDIHHGDAVEEAFYTSPRVMCVSFHKYGGFFPGTGRLDDLGMRTGLGYSVNVPLHEGVDDDSFMYIFKKVITLVMQQYDPEAIVIQCGADSLSGDRLGSFNMSLKGHAFACDFLRKQNVPLLILGGGGYTLRNVPKCWANETGVLLNMKLDNAIPKESQYYGFYAPDYTLNVRTSNMENLNSTQQLDCLFEKITENFRDHVYPVCTGIVPSLSWPETPTTTRTFLEEAIPDDVVFDSDPNNELLEPLKC